MIGPAPTIIAGIPVDNPANRAHAVRCCGAGAGAIGWPAPYPDSVTADCRQCGGQLYLGPELRNARTVLGGDALVLCLLCAALAAAAEGAEPWIVPLSDKETTTGE